MAEIVNFLLNAEWHWVELRVHYFFCLFWRLEWLELKKEYKTLQREAMKNLKKQLQEKIPVNSSQAGNKPLKSTQNRADASYKETEEKSSQDGGATVKTLSYTPGVLLKFHCQGRGMTKKELRVRGNKIA